MTFEKRPRVSLLPLAIELLLSARVRLTLNFFRRSGESVFKEGIYGH